MFSEDILQNTSFKKRVLFIGMPDMALVCYDKLYRAGVNIVAAVPPSKSNPSFSFFVSFLKNYNANIITHEKSLEEPEFLEKLKDLNIDIAVVCSYNKLFPAEFLKCAKDGFINSHPSLLPEYRGPNPYSQVLIHNEKMTGVTLHFMDENFDTGDIIYQKSVKIPQNATMGILFNNFNFVAADMLIEVLEYYEKNGVLPRTKQPLGDFKPATAIVANGVDNQIDWCTTAENIDAFVRALNPFIIAVTSFRNQSVKIMATKADSKRSKHPPGTVCETRKGLGVSTADGIIFIKVLQFGSYLICDGEDFIKRFNVKIGETFF